MAQALFQNFFNRCLSIPWSKPVRLVASVIVFALPFLPTALQNAIANGDTRTLVLHHAHTGEDIAITFRQDGAYDQAALKKLNWFLRDWRSNEPMTMDPRLFDIVWEVYRASESKEPIMIVSAYRSPQTNAMLRARSRAVAKHSQHMLGKAMDVHFADVPMSRIREIAMRMQEGGVGFYPNNFTPFVHIDAGSVRHWPRMSHNDLARLFPDGKTVHIPSDGVPLAGYEVAKLEIEQRGGNVASTQIASATGKSFFAALFGSGEDDEDTSVMAPQARNGAGKGGFSHVASLETPTSSGQNDDSRNFFLNSNHVASSPSQSEPKPNTAATPKLAQLDLTAAKQNLPQGETFLSAPSAASPPVLPEPPVPPLPPQRSLVLASLTNLASQQTALNNVPIPPLRTSLGAPQTASLAPQDPIGALLAHNNSYASNQPFAHQIGEDQNKTTALAYAPLTKGKLHDLDAAPVGSLGGLSNGTSATLTPENVIRAALHQSLAPAKPSTSKPQSHEPLVMRQQKSARLFGTNQIPSALYPVHPSSHDLAILLDGRTLMDQIYVDYVSTRSDTITNPQAKLEAHALVFGMQAGPVASGFYYPRQFWGGLVKSDVQPVQTSTTPLEQGTNQPNMPFMTEHAGL